MAFWDKPVAYTQKVVTVIEWPTDDLAAVIGVEAAWLTGMLLAVKFLTIGLWHEFKKSDR
jgi:hypothetical protein